MTADELRELLGAVVEQKLLDLLGDPDEGLVVAESLRRRLLRQKKAVAKGERGERSRTLSHGWHWADRPEPTAGARSVADLAPREGVLPTGRFPPPRPSGKLPAPCK
jgi:hypothetical protein